jgi:glycosyltransferase involved in cell wall biosynthesis
MRILLTSYVEPCSPSGVQTYYTLLKSSLEECGHDVRLVTPSNAPRTVRWITGTFRQVAGLGGPYLNLLAHEAKFWCRIYAAVRNMRWKPDIIHAQDVGSGTAAATALEHRYPVLVTAHFNENPVDEILTQYGLAGHPARRLHYLFSQQFFGIRNYVAPSHHAANHLRPLVPSNSRITIVPNACDFEAIGAIKPADDLRSLATTHKIILSAGTLEPRKDPSFLIELATALAPCADLVMAHAGDGPSRREIESIIAKRNLTNIHLLGHRTDLAAVMKNATLFIHFPHRETFGLVLIEAIAAGVPVLARKVGGISDILGITESTALFDAQASAASVGRDILRLITNTESLNQLREQQYRETRKHFDKPTFIQTIIKIYRDLEDSRQKP